MEEPYFYEGYELSEQVMVSFRSLDRKSQFQGGLRRRGGGRIQKTSQIKWIRGGDLYRIEWTELHISKI